MRVKGRIKAKKNGNGFCVQDKSSYFAGVFVQRGKKVSSYFYTYMQKNSTYITQICTIHPDPAPVHTLGNVSNETILFKRKNSSFKKQGWQHCGRCCHDGSADGWIIMI